jgi:predicted ArsR family transcriptional regulator
LKDRLPPEALDQVLREVGRSMAGGGDDSPKRKQAIEARLEKALQVLESLGGNARIEKDGDGFIIRSGSCPLAAAVSTHPEVCKLAEALVATVVGAPVRERCDREKFPRCRFEVDEVKQ